ncbi:potassium channel family protein [Neolewinella antarctica]|uniref:Voltage-gated potassium channel n=1 Tax=Neolewinella antarctica TaxID=442734 RepID=A0ABX0XF69_9BACT|nr:potassium channel protein [Neolewinella antarctica]NJC27970.1 voltage-gated potassium channel [Neolewinella antarctica]
MRQGLISRLLNALNIRSTTLDLRTAVLLIVGMTGLITVGLVVLEDYGFIDAFYTAAITISTVGFGEVAPLSQGGRVFMSVMIIFNVGIVAYALAAFSYYVIEGKLFEQMDHNRRKARVNALSGHTILCGFGRYGKEIARHLIEHGKEFVIIDEKERKVVDPEFEEFDLIYIIGDATHDEILEEAGLSRASGLITALDDDSDNLFIVLSAKDLNPNARIISRSQTARSRQKMMKAGASHVIMPEQIGGFFMATLISKPGAVEFFSYVTNEMDSDIGFEEILYKQLPAKLRGLPIMELGLRNNSGVNIIGHRKGNGRYVVNPGPDASLAAGESFIVVGSQPQILALREYLDI